MPGAGSRAPQDQDLAPWFAGRLPDGWFTGAPEVVVDRDEILVIGTLPEPAAVSGEDTEAGDPGARAIACAARIDGFREETRAQRMKIADEAERRFGRKLAWAARCGDASVAFTQLSVPVMTRLRMGERRVLDTLVDAGVARSRSDALAWCVRLVRQHEGEWIDQLREALVDVERVRGEGPTP
ncbi:MAG TPA: hypothetical protein VIH82_12445 [Acidimicrobiia bacterium]